MLGTVQFGLAYGIAGRGTVVPEHEVRSILAAAWDGGIRTLDTAPGYGDIEARLSALAAGLPFTVVSKIAPVPAGASARDAVVHVTDSCRRSQQRLGDRLSVLLFHRADDLLETHGDAVWHAAVDVVGIPDRVGVSCYDPASLAMLRERYPIAVAQVPGNALDQRLASRGVAARIHGIEIHLRSAFLQGLLLLSPDEGGRRLPAAAAHLRAWSDWCHARAIAPVTGALAIARALPGVRHCVVGVDSQAQLNEILSAWDGAVPREAPELACLDEAVLDPRSWAVA